LKNKFAAWTVDRFVKVAKAVEEKSKKKEVKSPAQRLPKGKKVATKPAKPAKPVKTKKVSRPAKKSVAKKKKK
jgi:hypothetical protein